MLRSEYRRLAGRQMRSDKTMDVLIEKLVFQFRSRILRAVYYDAAIRKMIIQSAHGRFFIYRDVGRDVIDLLASHPAPGALFDKHLRKQLRAKRERMTLSNIILLRRARKILVANNLRAGQKYASDNHP